MTQDYWNAGKKMETPVEAIAEKSNQQPDVDDIAKAVAGSLEKDAEGWNVDKDNKWARHGADQRLMSVYVGAGASGLTVEMATGGTHYRPSTTDPDRYPKQNSVASDSQDHIWNAYKAWQSRRMVERLNWTPAPPPAAEPKVEVVASRWNDAYLVEKQTLGSGVVRYRVRRETLFAAICHLLFPFTTPSFTSEAAAVARTDALYAKLIRNKVISAQVVVE